MGAGPSAGLLIVAPILFGLLLLLFLLPLFIGSAQPIVVTSIAMCLVFFASLIAAALDLQNPKKTLVTIVIQSLALGSIFFIELPNDQRLWVLGLGFALIILIQFGSTVVQYLRNSNMRRLGDSNSEDISTLVTVFGGASLESRSLAYFGLPIGLSIGSGVVRLFPSLGGRSATSIPLASALLCAAIILALEIRRNMRRMSTTYSNNIKDETRALDIACASTDLRKTILWSSMYATAVLGGLLIVLLELSNLQIPSKFIAWGILLIMLIAVQAPYVYGQMISREELLRPFEGLAREEVREKMEKYAPLFPVVHGLQAMVLTFTAGGFVHVFLEKAIEKTLGVPN